MAYTACSADGQFSALLADVYEKRLSAPSLTTAEQRRVQVNVDWLKGDSRAWPVALKFHTLFDSVLRNNRFEGGVLGSASNGHPAPQPDADPAQEENNRPQNHNFDTTSLGFGNSFSALTSTKRCRAHSSAVSHANKLGMALQPETPTTIFTSLEFRQSHYTALGNGNFHENAAPSIPIDASYSVPADPFSSILVAPDTPYTYNSP